MYSAQVLVMQTSASQMLVSVGEETVELNTDLQVSGIALNDEVVAAWSGKVVAVYHLVPLSSMNVIGMESSCFCPGTSILCLPFNFFPLFHLSPSLNTDF